MLVICYCYRIKVIRFFGDLQVKIKVINLIIVFKFRPINGTLIILNNIFVFNSFIEILIIYFKNTYFNLNSNF